MRAIPETSPSVPSVTRNDGSRTATVSSPLTTPTTSPTARPPAIPANRPTSRRKIAAVNAESATTDTDREIDLAGGQREREPDRHHGDRRRLADDVGEVGEREEVGVAQHHREEHEDDDERQVDDVSAEQRTNSSSDPCTGRCEVGRGSSAHRAVTEPADRPRRHQNPADPVARPHRAALPQHLLLHVTGQTGHRPRDGGAATPSPPGPELNHGAGERRRAVRSTRNVATPWRSRVAG